MERMTITEFLEARIAEDEKKASNLLKDLEGEIEEAWADMFDDRGPMTPDRLLKAQLWAQYDGQSKRRSFARGQQIATLANPDRVLAECAAKRVIVALYLEAELDGSYVALEYLPDALKALAAVYKDHPDYQQDWAL